MFPNQSNLLKHSFLNSSDISPIAQFHLACATGDTSRALTVLQQYKLDPNALISPEDDHFQPQQTTALTKAASNSHYETAKELIDQGAKANHSWLGLTTAIIHGDLQIATLMLNTLSSIPTLLPVCDEQQGTQYMNPLLLAVEYDRIQLIAPLMAKNDELSVLPADPIRQAINTNKLLTLAELVRNNATIYRQTKQYLKQAIQHWAQSSAISQQELQTLHDALVDVIQAHQHTGFPPSYLADQSNQDRALEQGAINKTMSATPIDKQGPSPIKAHSLNEGLLSRKRRFTSESKMDRSDSSCGHNPVSQSLPNMLKHITQQIDHSEKNKPEPYNIEHAQLKSWIELLDHAHHHFPQPRAQHCSLQ